MKARARMVAMAPLVKESPGQNLVPSPHPIVTPSSAMA